MLGNNDGRMGQMLDVEFCGLPKVAFSESSREQLVSCQGIGSTLARVEGLP